MSAFLSCRASDGIQDGNVPIVEGIIDAPLMKMQLVPRHHSQAGCLRTQVQVMVGEPSTGNPALPAE